MTERESLRRQYADSTKLSARASIYQYQHPRLDPVTWALQWVDWQPGQRVLDIGCGPGQYTEALAQRGLRRVAADLSPGMAAEARRRAGAPAVAADAADIPFPDHSFDRVLAMHMLYHCPDPERAVAELRRVLRPGGSVIALTNGANHLATLKELRNRACGTRLEMPFLRFSLENGGRLLRRYFSSVEVEHMTAELLVTDPDAVVAYFDSGRDFFEPGLATGITWEEARATLAHLVAEEVDRAGAWRTPTHSGVFCCYI